MAWNVGPPSAGNYQMFLAEVNYRINGKHIGVLTGENDWEVVDSGKRYKFSVGCTLELFDEVNRVIE